MTPGQRLQNALLDQASKKRKNKEEVADISTGKGVSKRRAQQIAVTAEAGFFAAANPSDISRPRTQQAYNEFHERPAIKKLEAERMKQMKHKRLLQLTREEQGQLYAGKAAQDTVKSLRKKGGKMTTQDKVVVQATLISCSTGTEAKEGVLGRQGQGFGFNGKNGKRKFRKFVEKKIEIDATDNRTLQTQVERKPRSDKLDGSPIFDTIFEANTDQVKGKRGTRRKYVGCRIVVLNDKRRRQSLYEEHPAGIRSMSLEEMRVIMKGADYYKEWKADPANTMVVQRLAREGDGDISLKALEQNEPYWSIRVGEKKCACHPHTGLQYACKALTLWRRLRHADCYCDCKNCGGRPDSEEHRNFGGNWDASGGQQCKRCYRSEMDAAAEKGTGKILPRTRDCVQLLEEEMSLTAKGKRAAAGGKAPENKNYTVHRRFFRCWDKDNPIPRVGQKEADAIPGTLSHYCFAAVSGPGKMQLRQYSCYCRHCCKREYEECQFKGVVRSRKHEPKAAKAAARRRAKVFITAGEQVIALTSVLPLRVTWKNTTTNQYTLSNSQHEELLHMCEEVNALDPRWQLKGPSASS